MGRPTQPVPAAGAPAAGAARTLQSPPPVYLSETDKQQILQSLGRPGWTITSQAALPDIEVGNEYGRPTLTSKGTYTITVSDPANPQAGGKKIVVRQGAPAEGGAPTWIAESPTPEVDTKARLEPKDAIYVKGMGHYLPDDPNNMAGTWSKVLPEGTPNADDEIIKAIDRQGREAVRNERERNEAAGIGYVDNETLSQMQSRAAGDKLGQDKLKEEIRQFGLQQKNRDAAQKNADDKSRVDILGTEATTEHTQAQTGLTRAQTGLTGAQQGAAEATTAKSAQDLARAQALLPTDIEQAQANVEATKQANQTAQQQRRIAGAPALTTMPQGPYSFTTNPETGEVTPGFNPAYQAKSQAEIAARVGQIQSMAQAKQAEVQQAVQNKTMTAEQGLTAFNTWWDQHVGPQQAALQAAQEEAQFQRAKDEAESRRAAMATAQNAGTQAISGYNALVGNPAASPVGPRYQETLNQIKSGKPLGEVDLTGAFNWNAPDPQELARNAVNESLKQIDPRAAMATGAPPPNYQAMDINGLLNRTTYTPGFGPPPPPPQPMQPQPPGPNPLAWPLGRQPETSEQAVARTQAALAAQAAQAAQAGDYIPFQ